MCGIFGLYDFDDSTVAKMTYYGLFALQHRGQESGGIAVSDCVKINCFKAMGLVNQIFNEKNLLQLKGWISIGHIRYSTTGSSTVENAQPLVKDTKYGPVALAHNGNLINTEELRKQLERNGVSFSGTSDSEVIMELLSSSSAPDIEAAVTETVKKCQGAFSLIILTNDKLIALRDPYGIRPLSIGKLEKSYLISSETCALDILGARFLRDVAAGEMVVVDKDGLRSKTWSLGSKEALCVFEFIYFARPDSVIRGRSLYDVRYQMGKSLAKQLPVEADTVIAVPESGVPAAIGYAAESKIPFGEGLIKNRYVGRTFIQPSQEIREMGVRLKLNPIKDGIRGKKIVLVDDSIVRGTTSRQIVKILREAGAREVHMRVSSPPYMNPCYYGIDTATRAELIAANLSIEGIRKYLDADTLEYLTIKNLAKAIDLPKDSMCMACLDGKYPVKVPERLENLKLLFKDS